MRLENCKNTIKFSSGLSSGQLQTRSYSCVIPSLCRDGSIIDPRILNPGGAASTNPLSGAGGGGGAPPSGGGGGGGAPPSGGGGGAPPSGGGGFGAGSSSPMVRVYTPCKSVFVGF